MARFLVSHPRKGNEETSGQGWPTKGWSGRLAREPGRSVDLVLWGRVNDPVRTRCAPQGVAMGYESLKSDKLSCKDVPRTAGRCGDAQFVQRKERNETIIFCTVHCGPFNTGTRTEHVPGTFFRTNNLTSPPD